MKIKWIFSIALVFILSLTSFTLDDNAIPESILDAIKKGDAELLSDFFNDNVELVVLDNEDIYSKAQALHILKNFFKDNAPRKFEILHHSGHFEGPEYAIGKLSCWSGDFRVYFLIKESNQKRYIQLLRIEPEN